MSLSEYFELVCPYYMLYGMTYNQFWHGNPWMARHYKEMHNLQRREKNEEMWINGMYQLSALSVALNNAFNKNKIKYIEKPFEIFPKSKAEKEQEIRAERQKLIDTLQQWKAMWDKQTGS